jgi:hypothetical protein
MEDRLGDWSRVALGKPIGVRPGIAGGGPEDVPHHSTEQNQNVLLKPESIFAASQPSMATTFASTIVSIFARSAFAYLASDPSCWVH